MEIKPHLASGSGLSWKYKKNQPNYAFSS